MDANGCILLIYYELGVSEFEIFDIKLKNKI